MKIEDKLLLEKNGWIVECESPFEIRHEETGSFASGLGAESIILGLRGESEMKFSIGELKRAFQDGGWVTMWSDMGIEMKYNTFEDWFKINYLS